ncbi:hypothetical protein pb186bvf_020082 [Paramecium bursaria]
MIIKISNKDVDNLQLIDNHNLIPVYYIYYNFQNTFINRSLFIQARGEFKETVDWSLRQKNQSNWCITESSKKEGLLDLTQGAILIGIKFGLLETSKTEQLGYIIFKIKKTLESYTRSSNNNKDSLLFEDWQLPASNRQQQQTIRALVPQRIPISGMLRQLNPCLKNMYYSNIQNSLFKYNTINISNTREETVEILQFKLQKLDQLDMIYKV